MNLEETMKGVQTGELDPLKEYIQLKAFEKRFKEVLSAVQDKAIDEARKYEQKSFKAFGAEIQMKANAGTWDYKTNPVWQTKKSELDEWQNQMQSAYYAKIKGNTIVDGNGEIVEPAIYKPGADNISIKLKE